MLDVAGKTDTLVIACGRCDRAGRYPVATLIEKHGPKHTIPALLRTLSAECPKRASISTDPCGVRCPELAGFFLAKRKAELDGVMTDPG